LKLRRQKPLAAGIARERAGGMMTVEAFVKVGL
jgi:hypothetical protein